MLDLLRWRLVHLKFNQRSLGSRSRLKELGQVQRQRQLLLRRPAGFLPRRLSRRGRRLEAKSAQAPKAEPKETKQADQKAEVKKEKGSGDDAPGDSRGSAEKQKRERNPEEPAKESTKREASKRPDDVDSRPGAAAREASGDDLHSALGRSSVKDAVAPLTGFKAMARKPEGSEVRLQSAERTAMSPVEGDFRTLPEGPILDAFLAMSSDWVLNRQVRDFIKNGEEGRWKLSTRSWRTLTWSGPVGGLLSPARLLGGPLGLWTLGILESRGGADIDRGVMKIEIEEGTMFGIVVVMIRSIENEIEGEMIAGDP